MNEQDVMLIPHETFSIMVGANSIPEAWAKAWDALTNVLGTDPVRDDIDAWIGVSFDHGPNPDKMNPELDDEAKDKLPALICLAKFVRETPGRPTFA